jgi:5-formyltetrahydrofolate cyclo-ligase
MLKSEARTFFLNKRKSLSPQELLKWDDLLLIQLQKMDWTQTHVLGSFFPMEHQNEPNSLLLTDYLNFLISDLKLGYPIVDSTHHTMQFFPATENTTTNTWGIVEPIKSMPINPSQIDTFLVPLLGFDVTGQRIGFGKGYYDKYFENLASSTLRIGISYFEPIEAIIDTHQFDVPLTHCITPWKIYEF